MFIYSGLFYTNEKEIKYVYTYNKRLFRNEFTTTCFFVYFIEK